MFCRILVFLNVWKKWEVWLNGIGVIVLVYQGKLQIIYHFSK
jgi:hypothetical protein